MYNVNMDTVRILPPSCGSSQVMSELTFDFVAPIYETQLHP